MSSMYREKYNKGQLSLATCKVIIKDEVNVKIEHLDLDTRKALVKKFAMNKVFWQPHK